MAATSSANGVLLAFPDITSNSLAAKLLAGFQRAQGLRQPWESTFDECFRYAMPGRSSFTERNKAQTDGQTIFDETAVVGVQEFASRIQSGIVPNFSRWANLEAGSAIPEDDRKQVNEDLDKVTEAVFEVLNDSNFGTEAFEALLDLSVSCGALEVFEGDAAKPVCFHAVPMPELYLEDGWDGRPAKIYRCRSYALDGFKAKYGARAKISKELEDDFAKGAQQFVEVVCRDMMLYAEEAWHKYVIHLKSQTIVWSQYYRGIGSCPIIVFRWSKTAGDTWGRGPLFNVLPAIKTCNLVVEMILENAQMAISGIWTMEDDGTINTDTIELVPGTIIPHAQGTAGLKNAGVPGNFDVAQLVLNEMRTNIKKGLYNEMLGNPEKTPMSATEVAERMADLARSIGSAFGRLQTEFVIPVLQRVVWILKRRGLIEMPALNGKHVAVRASSPLSQAQNHQDILAIDRLAGFVGERFGPQLANLFLKGEQISQYVAGKLQVPERFVRSEAEMKQFMSMIQGFAENMGSLPGGAAPGAPPEAPQGV